MRWTCATDHVSGMSSKFIHTVLHHCMNCNKPMHGGLGGELFANMSPLIRIDKDMMSQSGQKTVGSTTALICAGCVCALDGETLKSPAAAAASGKSDDDDTSSEIFDCSEDEDYPPLKTSQNIIALPIRFSTWMTSETTSKTPACALMMSKSVVSSLPRSVVPAERPRKSVAPPPLIKLLLLTDAQQTHP